MRSIQALAFMVTAAIGLVVSYYVKAEEAKPEILQGRGLVCDTAEQVKKAVAAFSNGEDGVAAVNRDEPSACGILIVAYIRKEKVGEVDSPQGKLDLVAIEIVAVHDGMMWRPTRPMPQVTAMPQDENKPPSPPAAKPSKIIHL